VIANGCLRKEARREHLDYINKGLLSQPHQGAKLTLAHCDKKHIVVFKQYILDNCDRLVKFEDIDVLKWTSDKVFMDQFPSVEGVRVKSLQS